MPKVVMGVNSGNGMEEITSKNNELVVRHTDTQYEKDTNGYEVLRIVDAAPFAYNETLDLARISQYCSNDDNLGSIHRLLSAATTNATSVKASAGRVHFLRIANTTGSAKYLKLYNKASAPTVGSDTPVMTFYLPASNVMNIIDNNFGIYLSTGIAYAITGAIADNDTTAVSANDVIVNMIYK